MPRKQEIKKQMKPSANAYLDSLVTAAKKNDLNAFQVAKSQQPIKKYAPLTMKFKKSSNAVYIPDYGYLDTNDVKNRNSTDIIRQIKSQQLVNDLIKEQQNPLFKDSTEFLKQYDPNVDVVQSIKDLIDKQQFMDTLASENKKLDDLLDLFNARGKQTFLEYMKDNNLSRDSSTDVKYVIDFITANLNGDLRPYLKTFENDYLRRLKENQRLRNEAIAMKQLKRLQEIVNATTPALPFRPGSTPPVPPGGSSSGSSSTSSSGSSAGSPASLTGAPLGGSPAPVVAPAGGSPALAPAGGSPALAPAGTPAGTPARGTPRPASVVVAPAGGTPARGTPFVPVVPAGGTPMPAVTPGAPRLATPVAPRPASPVALAPPLAPLEPLTPLAAPAIVRNETHFTGANIWQRLMKLTQQQIIDEFKARKLPYDKSEPLATQKSKLLNDIRTRGYGLKKKTNKKNVKGGGPVMSTMSKVVDYVYHKFYPVKITVTIYHKVNLHSFPKDRHFFNQMEPYQLYYFYNLEEVAAKTAIEILQLPLRIICLGAQEDVLIFYLENQKKYDELITFVEANTPRTENGETTEFIQKPVYTDRATIPINRYGINPHYNGKRDAPISSTENDDITNGILRLNL
ncbi:MAG: hypothetical protein JSS98_10920 [Bacteroidetes bacterium]|nr:hypothetical protein [Bacteroidota bacterium]